MIAGFIWISQITEDLAEITDYEFLHSYLVNYSNYTGDSNLLRIASKTGNSSICEMMNQSHYKDYCYRNTGIISNNITLCEKIDSDYHQYLCYKGIAANTVNTSLCHILSEDGRWVDLCYIEIAKAAKDISFCDYVNYSIAEMKEWCIQDVAIATEDISLCELISTPSQREKCKEFVLGYR